MAGMSLSACLLNLLFFDAWHGHVQVIRVAILQKTATSSLRQQEVHFVEQETIVHFS